MQRIDECSILGNRESLERLLHHIQVTAETELLNVDFKKWGADLQLEHCQSTETNGKSQNSISLAYVIFLLERKIQLYEIIMISTRIVL
jgi:hypothetical protein